MGLKPFRLRLHRRFRRSQKRVENLGAQTEQSIETLVYSRFERLKPVRRFVIGWLLLIVLLIGSVLSQTVLLNNYFQTFRPIPGGVYREGVLGRFSNANPLFASGEVDSTVSKLLFSSLFIYDGNNHLVGDLAKSYSVDERGTTYTVELKPHLTWQDGKPLTAEDVAFTYQTIQNPDVQSPLLSSWQGITVSVKNSHSVQFKLPSVLASFPYTLTNGIVPKHLLGKTTPSDLRTADFNTIKPVGSGPFAWQALQVDGNDPNHLKSQIALVAFDAYHAGKPKLSQFIVRAYSDKTELVRDFKTNQLTAVEGLNQVPALLTDHSGVQQHNLLLTAATMVFFKTTAGPLADTAVRRALTAATNQVAIIKALSYPTNRVREPLLQQQLGYDPAFVQLPFDTNVANSTLDAAGWTRTDPEAVRTKDGKPLSFTLTANATPEYRHVGDMLREQWRAVGADVKVEYQDDTNFQGTLSSHSYDAVLYGISVGVDPDVFVYWDSSQADIRSPNRLNLSEYKNATADAALESGRTRLSPELRVIKYRPFLEAWQKDAPAVGLYQPRLLYLTRGNVFGFEDHTVNTSTDRFYNVQNWQIRQAKVTNQ